MLQDSIVTERLRLTGNRYVRSLAVERSGACDAVREKNEREMASRIAMLSRKLSAKHLAASEDMDASAGDGLD
ncbi:hypothetical protein AU476_00740 [Cupriavidus sp. UYMSc13B]|nr:hypothetical protein AU476_00740 [Cupriavidus sp. UYMSc13B]